MSEENELVLMDRSRVQRTLKRMAYQIAENNRANRTVYLIGIKTRGMVTATILGNFLSEIYDREQPLFQLDLDDPDSELFTDIDIGGAYPLVVDDVIFSGKTMFTALNMIYAMAPFAEMHSAVLIDRGHRKFPIQSQFTGLEYSTKFKEHVSVVAENDTIHRVVVGIS